MTIELKDCPQKLIDAVEKELSNDRNSKLISIEKREINFYSKQTVVPKFVVIIECLYSFLIYNITMYDSLDNEVYRNIVSVVDIEAAFRNSETLKMSLNI